MKGFYKSLLLMALPISLQNLINFLVGMMDTVMLGQLGEVELAASSLANQYFFILMISLFGVANGANILIAQYWATNRTDKIRNVFGITLKLSLGLSVLFALGALFAPGFIMRLFTSDAAVVEQGVRYLRVIAGSYLLYGITCPILMMLRAVRTVMISSVVYVLSLLANIAANWVFIFGNLGAPRMGTAGAALGTVIARVVELVLVALFLLLKEDKLCLGLRDLLGFDRSLLPEFRRYVMPVVLNEIFWSVGNSILAMVIGHMGTQIVAANTICNMINQLVFIVVRGVSAAAMVMIGNNIHHPDLRKYANAFIRLSVVLGVLACVFTILLRDPVLAIYRVSEATKATTVEMLWSYAVIAVFIGITSTCLIGVLRGGGDGRFVMFADVLTIWLVAIPLGALFGLVWRLPAWLVVLAIKGDEVIKSVICLWRLKGTRWIHRIEASPAEDEGAADWGA